MKTSWSSMSILKEPGSSFVQKMMLAFLVIAVLFASLPAGVVSAAPADAASDADLEREWKDKIQNVGGESFFYERVRVYPADFKDPAELARAHELLNNYGISYRAAQTLIFNHVGFDAEGDVINEIQANQTIKDVAEHLRIMRSIRNKLDKMEGEYRLLPLSAITTTTAQ